MSGNGEMKCTNNGFISERIIEQSLKGRFGLLFWKAGSPTDLAERQKLHGMERIAHLAHPFFFTAAFSFPQR